MRYRIKYRADSETVRNDGIPQILIKIHNRSKLTLFSKKNIILAILNKLQDQKISK
jgi:hypothetical protein